MKDDAVISVGEHIAAFLVLPFVFAITVLVLGVVGVIEAVLWVWKHARKLAFALVLFAVPLFAGPPATTLLTLKWNAPPASYTLTNDVGALFTNYLTGYRVYAAPTLTTPSTDWTLVTNSTPTDSIQLQMVNGAQFYKLTATYTTNGSSATCLVSEESPPSNVAASYLPKGGDNLRATK